MTSGLATKGTPIEGRARMKRSKRMTMTAALLAMLSGGGFALAEASAPDPADHAAHHPPATPAPVPKTAANPKASPAPAAAPVVPGGASGAMGGGTMHGGMMGGGMMQGGMMAMGGGMCPMMGGGGPLGGASTKVDVKKVDKGVTITLTSPDPATATRLQKMAEAMRLMHEATAQ